MYRPIFTKLKLTKILSNTIFVLIQTAFWMNTRISSIVGEAPKALWRQMEWYSSPNILSGVCHSVYSVICSTTGERDYHNNAKMWWALTDLKEDHEAISYMFMDRLYIHIAFTSVQYQCFPSFCFAYYVLKKTSGVQICSLK